MVDFSIRMEMVVMNTHFKKKRSRHSVAYPELVSRGSGVSRVGLKGGFQNSQI